MSLLEKLNEKISPLEVTQQENSPPTESLSPSTSLAPSTACPACGSLQFWLDAYGRWHCPGCEPADLLSVPLAAVRDVATVEPQQADDDSESPPAQFQSRWKMFTDHDGTIRLLDEDRFHVERKTGIPNFGPPKGVEWEKWWKRGLV
jgi:hypothetical protein